MIYLCRTFLNVLNTTINKYSQNARNAGSEEKRLMEESYFECKKISVIKYDIKLSNISSFSTIPI